LTSAGGSVGSSPHAGDEFVLGRPARPSVSPFALAALLLEVIAFVILIAIQATEPAFTCFDVPYGEWVDRMNIPFTAATLMIPLGLILAIVGAFRQRRQPSLIINSVWFVALLLGLGVNPFLWSAGFGSGTRAFGCL
jgi:hypothetical protein